MLRLSGLGKGLYKERVIVNRQEVFDKGDFPACFA